VTWFPGFEFAGNIFFARPAQFGHDLRILRRKPILKLIERFDR
jgi:hypothetical protein